MLGIASYTFDTWGEIQAIKYLNDLEQCVLRLAEHPNLGR
jgi:plasmid stabilization system protein ParE